MDTPHKLAHAVLLPGFAGTTAPDWLRRRIAEGLGGVVLFGRNVVDDEQVTALSAALRAERDDVVVGIDEEGGDVTRLDAAAGSRLPGGLALAAAGDVNLTAEVGLVLGARLARCGVTLNLAPCADLSLTQDDPIIGVRAFGSDPSAAAAHVAATVRGMQRSGVAACAKHFPGHGAATADSHLTLPVLARTPEELAVTELVPFRAAIDAGVRAIMSGHLVVPAWGPEPATTNEIAIGKVLRGDLGFTGTVVTDAIEMGAVAGTLGDAAGLREAAVRALAAGADALCVGGDTADADAVTALVERIVQAVRDGVLTEERLAEAAARTRALGASASPITGVRDELDLGLEVARKALRATEIPDLGAAPLVVDVEVAPTIAAGPVAWGLAPHLAELLPGAVSVAPSELGDVVSKVVIVTTRDAHRHPVARELVRRLVDASAIVVHVETGVPGPGLGAAARIDTHGGSWSSLRAAAELLAYRDGRLRPPAAASR
ncbi:glycoside hydrolase family 3 protein [Actinokineospora xionganensis]|uniref:Glycoside hydrolase family 3 protein n=1 Tax=Actinokineospora xionganensis TaxID=2684470 RepID=A0ABR7LFY7_9PSEU|nr:glycoside hydrolase family 3 protein [Actinokineospora xionganensis]MBC6451648.1 glycoside hydrolase family 3 protein [Actinokineospora xionganensis]